MAIRNNKKNLQRNLLTYRTYKLPSCKRLREMNGTRDWATCVGKTANRKKGQCSGKILKNNFNK